MPDNKICLLLMLIIMSISIGGCKKPDNKVVAPETPRYTSNMKGLRSWQCAQSYSCSGCDPVIEPVNSTKVLSFEIVVANDTTVYDGTVPESVRTASDAMHLVNTDVANEVATYQNNGQGVNRKIIYNNKTNTISYTCNWDSTRDNFELICISQ